MDVKTEIFSQLLTVIQVNFPTFISQLTGVQENFLSTSDERNRRFKNQILGQFVIIIDRDIQIFEQTDVRTNIEHLNRFTSQVRVTEYRLITVTRT